MTRLPLLLLAAASLLSLTNCVPSNSTSGELDNGRFTYSCVDATDAACAGFAGETFTPNLIAVGGTFALGYVADDSSLDPVQLVPASDQMITKGLGGFKILIPGVAAVLARNTSGVVSDFIHLNGASVDHLDVSGPSSSTDVTEVTMDTDNDVKLQATPKSELGAQLAGALDYAWTTSDATIVALDTTGARRLTTLSGLKPGKATVVVSLPSGLKKSVVVTVKQGTNTSSGTGGEGGSGSTSSSTGTTGAGGAGGGK